MGVKSNHKSSNKAVMIFPEKKNLGICNIGHQVIYKLINSHEEFYCDRMYLTKACVSEEQGWSISKFDYIFVSLSFDTNLINYINLMEYLEIPLFSEHRNSDIASSYPLIICGGMFATYNPEIIADYFDAIVMGEGENVISDILDILCDNKNKAQHQNVGLKIKCEIA